MDGSALSYFGTASDQFRANGVMVIVQNNRDFKHSEFLDVYEALLEKKRLNYSHYYRDFLQEMSDGFGVNLEKISFHTRNWTMTIPSEDFIGMSCSSTQAQGATARHREKYLRKLVALVKKYEVQGSLEILY